MQCVTIEPWSLGHSLIQLHFQSSSYGFGSLGIRSLHCVDVEHHNACEFLLSLVMATTLNSRIVSFSLLREKHSHIFCDLGAHVTPNSLSDWGSLTCKVD
jgi:hypothetical protein